MPATLFPKAAGKVRLLLPQGEIIQAAFFCWVWSTSGRPFGCGHSGSGMRTQATVGSSCSQVTAPEVARSMAGQCDFGTSRSCSHCHTAPRVTPRILASSTRDPVTSAAFLIGFVSMSKSIEILDRRCQENLDHARKESQYHPQMDTRAIISRWVKEARSAAGLNQTELAEHLGLTKGNISAWENQRHEPSVAQLVKVAEVCRHRLPAELDIEGRLTDEAVRFALSYQALPQEFRKQLSDALTTAEIAAKSLAG